MFLSPPALIYRIANKNNDDIFYIKTATVKDQIRRTVWTTKLTEALRFVNKLSVSNFISTYNITTGYVELHRYNKGIIKYTLEDIQL